MAIDIVDWHKLHGEQWNPNDIIKDTYLHPAKWSRGLIKAIYNYINTQINISRPLRVLDPFGGVALGALDAMLLGYQWTGVELEESFHAIAVQNIDKWKSKYGGLVSGYGSANIINGDSRFIQNYVDGLFDVIVSSPPYADVVNGSGEGPGARHDHIHHKGDNATKKSSNSLYGNSDGQMGQMRVGAIDGSQPNTFWNAAAQVLAATYSVCRPEAIAFWNTRDFIRKGERVWFADQWADLCIACGWKPVLRIRSWLVEDYGSAFDIFGNTQPIIKQRKSQVRRLNEKRGLPSIDWEDVTITVKE